jgi:hypothetical protein
MRPTVVTRRWMPERCGVQWVIPVWDATTGMAIGEGLECVW